MMLLASFSDWLVGWLMVMLMIEIEDELRFGSEIP